MTEPPPPRASRASRAGRLIAAGAVLAGAAALLVRPSPRGPRTARGSHTHTPSVASMHEGYEVKDLPARDLAMILATFGVSAALLVGVVFLMIGLFSGWDHDSATGLTVAQTTAIAVPGPHLQVDAVADLNRERAAEAAALHGYAWTDPGHHRAHIPIERAMALVAGHSLDDAP